ncbi:hypothetical protein FHR83_007009 [Actinoplanes campanulatus]|uniref:Uncharacterized protein n=1 Tax=Actinoplanes campanulatus TaxID=113559 RepID=A0A7W5AN16_9ACTN|nr:hypothetical protein [Actinoplanes campanulatus]MBB3099303.1 hypothetical protein [Actinoplanes campanulatus]GGN40561.1 hypothetical protein GCM10010109_69820 [Actinoplanes campanulatus]GID40621.1 hypothetical protein Aca09nite_71270 [Actinoplanes campanulatus]
MPRKNDVALEVYYDGAWHDLVIGDYVLAGQQIKIQRGDGAQSAAMRPALLTAQLSNDEDLFRNSNPESPLYGKAGRNVPIRVSVGGVVRGHVQVSRWEASESRDFRAKPKRGSAWVDVEAGGLLQQIHQWKEPLKSPLVRNTLSLSNLIGFWPLEDPRDAPYLSTPMPGGIAGVTFGEVTLGGEQRPGGATAAAEVAADGVLTGRFLRSTASGYQLTFSAYIPATLTAAYQEIFRWTDSRNRVWAWEINDASYAYRIYDSDGSTLSYTSDSYGTQSPVQWVRFRMKVTVSGGTITYEPAWYPEGATFTTGSTQTFSGTATGQPRTWLTPRTDYSTGAFYSCVYAVDDPDIDLVSDSGVLAAFNGHAGERARNRFGRLMNEMGLPWNAIGTTALSEPMGVQPAAPFADILKEIRDTEDGLMFDAIDNIAVIFLLRNARYNRTAVRIDVNELPGRPREVTDDLGVYNIVTVSQRDGGEAAAEDATSPIGSQSSPDGIGPYEQTIDVNIDDEAVLPGLAGWWLNRGTVDLPRYPAVTVNLAALDPDKVAEIEDIDVGDALEITGYREYDIRLQVVGYTETIGWPNARSIVFTTVPDQIFDVGTYDGDRRYDLRTATVSAVAGPTATTLTIGITDDEAWSSTSAYDLMIAGELVGVPVGGMGARTGSAGAYQQVLTGAVRSKNGVRKTLPVGAEVHIATPGRWAR